MQTAQNILQWCAVVNTAKTFWVQEMEGISLLADWLLDSREALWSMQSVWVSCSLYCLFSKVQYWLDFPLCFTDNIERVETV
jgi:hypothetical protein